MKNNYLRIRRENTQTHILTVVPRKEKDIKTPIYLYMFTHNNIKSHKR